MKVLVACEYSGVVRDAFRASGMTLYPVICCPRMLMGHTIRVMFVTFSMMVLI